MRRTTLLIALALTLLMVSEAFAKKRILVYTGRLLDERSAPIGGVFPLTFAFYAKSRGGKAVWSENHFVAVDKGSYIVELGRKKLIPRSVKIDSLYVGVRISGGVELVRERFVAEGNEPEEIIHHKTRDSKRGQTGGGPNSGPVDLARKATFAYHAGKADNAVKLDGLTLDQLKKVLGGGGSKGGGDLAVTIPDKTHNPKPAGGTGGNPYEQLCPPNWVVTGLRGGSGLYVDRVQIICSPLELSPSKKGRKTKK